MKGPRVLLVEDDDDTRSLIRAALVAAGFNAVVALDGMAALRSVAATKPDLVLLDIGLPVMSGDDFVREWRRRADDAASVPILAVSGRRDGPDIARSIAAAGFIAKPFDVDQLIAVVRVIAGDPGAISDDTVAQVAVGQVGSGTTGRIGVHVRPGPRPFLIVTEREGHAETSAELTAVELETLRTLLDVAGRQQR